MHIFYYIEIVIHLLNCKGVSSVWYAKWTYLELLQIFLLKHHIEKYGFQSILKAFKFCKYSASFIYFIYAYHSLFVLYVLYE